MRQVLYGECVRSGEATVVRISALADAGCDLETDAPILAPAPTSASSEDGECSLWIGAVGPFAATAQRKDSSHLLIRFKEPLPGAIVSHFNGG